MFFIFILSVLKFQILFFPSFQNLAAPFVCPERHGQFPTYSLSDLTDTTFFLNKSPGYMPRLE